MTSGQPTPGVVAAADLAGIHAGSVETFDHAAGLGTVRLADGQRLGFHCTAIADGTRTIDVGAAVAFIIVTAQNGAVEARAMITVG